MRVRSGFTIIEIIVVIVIIGILAALAIPSSRIQMLRIQSQEGVRILRALWEAQKDYYRDNNAYATSLDQLAVDIPAPKNFQAPVLDNGITPLTCGLITVYYLARIEDNTGTYTLYARNNGLIGCRRTGFPCQRQLCEQMGYPE